MPEKRPRFLSRAENATTQATIFFATLLPQAEVLNEWANVYHGWPRIKLTGEQAAQDRGKRRGILRKGGKSKKPMTMLRYFLWKSRKKGEDEDLRRRSGRTKKEISDFLARKCFPGQISHLPRNFVMYCLENWTRLATFFFLRARARFENKESRREKATHKPKMCNCQTDVSFLGNANVLNSINKR